MRVVVKLGGTLLDEPGSRQRLATELAAVVRNGVALVIVHGGGKQMTRFLTERGVESRFINGLRVTTPDVVDAVLKVVAGSVNQELVAALVTAGIEAVGLSGVDAGLVQAEPLSEELGAVGRPVRTEARLLRLLTGHGFTPVVACVAGDVHRQGRIYNVNADQLAVACATGFHADQLLFLTDVDGVRGTAGTVEPRLTVADVEFLIAAEVATGGMRAKLSAATQGLGEGIGRVVVAPGFRPGATADLLSGSAVGTAIERG